MLTMQNTGKYISNKWSDERQKAMKNSDITGDYTQDELKLTDEDIGGKYNPDTYIKKTTPVDAFTTPREYDGRTDPKIDG